MDYSIDERVVEGMALEEPSATQEVNTYPNPMGKYADFGRFRDAWFAILWISVVSFLFVFSGLRYEKLTEFDPSVKVRVYPSFEFQTIPADGSWHVVNETKCNKLKFGCGEKELQVFANDNHRSINVSFSADSVEVGACSLSFARIQCEESSESSDSSDFEIKIKPRHIMYVLGAIGFAFFIGVSQLVIMWYYPKQFIIVQNVFLSLVFIGLGVFEGVYHNYLAAVKFGFWGIVFGLLYLFVFRNRLDFAAQCLKMSSHVVLSYWGNLFVQLLVVALNTVVTVAFILSLTGTPPTGAIYGFLLILYWSRETLKNIGHVTMAGTTSHWFFALGGPGTPPYFLEKPVFVTLAAFQRSLWSLGSICFGSLVVAILHLIRAIVRSTIRRVGVLACMLMCLLSFIEFLVRYFNDYAFVQVAMFGKPYITAAKDTWTVIKSGAGFDAVVNDSLLSWVFISMSLQGGLLTGVLFYFATGRNILWAIILSVVAVVIISTINTLLYSGVITVFIGFWQLRSVGEHWSAPAMGEDVVVGAVVCETLEKKYGVGEEQDPQTSTSIN